MNRIEIIGMIMGMRELMEEEKYEAVKRVMDTILQEAKTKASEKNSGNQDNK